jgi:hypothetical protein
MFCAPELVFDGTEGVESRFHVLRSRTRFQRYRGRPIPISYFLLPDMFMGVPRAPVPFLTFYALELIFRLYRGCRFPFSCFTRTDSFSSVPGASGPVFMFCAARTCFRRYQGRRVPFSCFARPDSFSRVSRSSDPVFMFCAPGLVFNGTKGVGSRFHVLRSQPRFQRYRGRPISFSCFALQDSFSAIPRASDPVFMFSAPRHVFAVPRASGPFLTFCAP